MKDFLEIFITVAPILSLGTILVTFINYFLNKKSNPSEFEKKKMEIYEEVYFKGIKNGIGEEIDQDVSIQYFSELINKMIEKPKDYTYISSETKKALRYWKNNKIPLSKLRYRIEIEYEQLQYRFNQKNRIFNFTTKYIIYLFLFLLSIGIIIPTIYFIFNDFNFISALYNEFTLSIFLYSILICIITGIHLWEDRYLFLGRANNKSHNQQNKEQRDENKV